MTNSSDTITRQDIQIAVNRLNAVMVEAAPKFQAFLELLVGSMVYWMEQAELSRQASRTTELPLIVDHVEQPEIEELRQKVQKLEQQLELKEYTDQNWFST